MAYGLARVKNLSAGCITSAETHNGRKYEELGLPTPSHIRPDGPAAQFGQNSHHVIGGDSLKEAIDNRLQQFNIKPRKNAVVALEYVVGIVGTPDEIKQAYTQHSPSNVLCDNLAFKFLSERHGRENIVSISLHFDETTPHAHVVVVPLVEKSVKWKNSKGEGERKEMRLCARDFTGGKDLLRQLQTDVYEFLNNFAVKLGIKFWRGTKKEEQLKEYTRQTSHEIGAIKLELSNCQDLAKAKRLEYELAEKSKAFERKQAEQTRIIEQHKKTQGKDERWKKGKDFGMGF